MGLRSRWVK